MKEVLDLGNSLIARDACEGNEETMKVGILLRVVWAKCTFGEASSSFSVSTGGDAECVLWLTVFPLTVHKEGGKPRCSDLIIYVKLSI